MRLRPLTEAECYARCYGGSRTDQVNVLFPDNRERETERVTLVRLRESGQPDDQPAEAA